ncbi:IpaD/SipD/SspD family type III secretion system needle tip protein [Acerihabitans arboris]|uniref:IpaD/SipD/SspD family type III secretion system needle tip protein n=1 Tax=Acerihabitans arboris TaxID=2691583 RepID=A0A845SDN7_9GAMM|nr:IpaD/SipD/SspD family type III secretion system needle tip protein [Acerihabitans arboris]NDL61512.1 IpaD/SipD/SspD family type III secretion system needle tip protein [Acerihabitans arboris]
MPNVIFHYPPVFQVDSRAVSDPLLDEKKESINTAGNQSDSAAVGANRRNSAIGYALIENAENKSLDVLDSIGAHIGLMQDKVALFDEKLRDYQEIYRNWPDAEPLSIANRPPEPPFLSLPRLPEGEHVENTLRLREAEAEIHGARALGALSTEEADFWLKGIKNITAYENFYQEYENGVKAFTSLISEFNAFKGKKTQYLTILKDSNGNDIMQFDKAILAELQTLIDKFSGNAGIMFPASGSASRADADKWAQEWDMDPQCVQEANGGWVVRVDLAPLETIKKDLEKSGVDKTMNSFQYQSWESGFNAQGDTLQNTMQILMTQLTNKFGERDVQIKGLNEWIEARRRQFQSLQSDR